ncbi:MAG TPA: hypothetical protein PKM67_09875 [Kiritimatiellia bacterium]|nr:hypothetical protein [Kiritimatiellia bacterium]HNR94018.1 hypothetical protein [Kiritimatiellia bacterium]HNS81751.1 hypothetical protein [Kiritimatiellia bacterium]HPA77510.1 hypothetical protein [Kiritimatiellia bacterium]HQQ03453.1 hypothetical protein [Kiritimatiellia bacterium]
MDTNRWAPPKRPLLLELLALVFVVLAIAIPTYLQNESTPSLPAQDTIAAQMQSTREVGGIDRDEWRETSGSLFWGIGILGLYIVHLYIANSSNDRISTSVAHFLSPLVFAMITYYRLYSLKESSIEVVSGSPLEILKWAIGVFLITLLLARLRMVGYRKQFSDITWDMSTPALYDKTFFELMVYIYPLLYPPRRYHLCPQGILIEGWFYIMPIPFDVIHSVDAMKSASFLSTGTFLAASTKTLTRVQMNDQRVPVYISPEDKTGLLKYCANRLAPLTPDARTPIV